MSSANDDQGRTEAAGAAAPGGDQPAAAGAHGPGGDRPAAPAVTPRAEAKAAAAPAPTAASAGAAGNLDFVLDVPLRVTVEIGSAEMRVAELLQVDKGSVIELDRLAGEPADVLVNGRFVARGEVTVVDDRLAVRILEIDGRSVGRSEG